MMPDGIRCRAVLTPLITSVGPALSPPWKRTTACAWSVSQSTTLPLPSSPHCVPTTTTLWPQPDVSRLWPRSAVLICCMSKNPKLKEGTRFRVRSECAHDPLAVDEHELAVAGELLTLVLVAGQDADDAVAALAQAPHGLAQCRVFAPRRADCGVRLRTRCEVRHGLQVQAQTDRRPVPAEHRADLVVTPAARDRIGPA